MGKFNNETRLYLLTSYSTLIDFDCLVTKILKCHHLELLAMDVLEIAYDEEK